ncbi:hypothetical protein NQZ68_031646 [Dissostichus eleginoides]|nr:hypothetical protein NQZ68_031646 [Dissostichus eleginoides]
MTQGSTCLSVCCANCQDWLWEIKPSPAVSDPFLPPPAAMGAFSCFLVLALLDKHNLPLQNLAPGLEHAGDDTDTQDDTDGLLIACRSPYCPRANSSTGF